MAEIERLDRAECFKVRPDDIAEISKALEGGIVVRVSSSTYAQVTLRTRLKMIALLERYMSREGMSISSRNLRTPARRAVLCVLVVDKLWDRLYYPLTVYTMILGINFADHVYVCIRR